MQINTEALQLLSTAVQTRFAAGLARATTPWQFLAMEIPSTTGANIYPFLKEMGRIREWVGDRVIQNIEAGSYQIRNRDFEETHGIDRNAVLDDTYGVYGPMFEQTGRNVAMFPADKVFETLKAGATTLGPDGQYFFDTDHPVGAGVASNDMGGAGTAWYIVDGSQVYKPVIWQPRQAFDLVRMFDPKDEAVFWKKQYLFGVDGRAGVGFSPFWQLATRSRQTLDDAGLEAAMTQMSTQTGADGRTLKLSATHLVVPPALGETARKLIGRELLVGGGSNTLHNRLEVVVAPELA